MGRLASRPLARLRYEFPRYRYSATAEGNEKQKPVAYEEDALCALRYLANVFFPRRAPKSFQERIEERLPPTLREDYLRNLPWEEWQGIASRRTEAITEAELEMKLTARNGRLWMRSVLRTYLSKRFSSERQVLVEDEYVQWGCAKTLGLLGN